jgi:hypothetical protein
LALRYWIFSLASSKGEGSKFKFKVQGFRF